ncbi:reverse transcriptase, partial [Phytophthora megakarya]
MSQKTDMNPSPVADDPRDTSDLDLTWDSDPDYDECVYYHEGSDLYAEDVDGQMAVLPEMVNYSRSPWASPIVVIIKRNGVDIRLCIDYRLVNSLTRVMIYPMPLVNDLLENPKSTLWYCSLHMASGFWVVKMTDRARLISACITPFGLFEWNRMPFGLKNAPQIYQRVIDNALYGFIRIPKSEDHGSTSDLFEDGEPVDTGKPS